MDGSGSRNDSAHGPDYVGTGHATCDAQFLADPEAYLTD